MSCFSWRHTIILVAARPETWLFSSYTMYNVKSSVCRSIIQWFAKEFPNYRHLQNLHPKKGASRTRGLGGRVRHEMSRSKIISRQWPLVVHHSRGLVGWSQVVWLGNGHKAVTVQGPRRPLLRSVLCSILILGLLPPPPVADQSLTSSPTSPATTLAHKDQLFHPLPYKDQDALKTARPLCLSCCRPGPQSLQVQIL